MKKILCMFLAALIPALCLSGCSKVSVQKYNSKSEITVLDVGTVASNDSFDLSFDPYNMSVSLLCKENSRVWSTCPDDDSADDDEKGTIMIRVQDTRIIKEFSVGSGGASRIGSEKIENGVKITYYFDSYQISVPVCYTLREDSMLISVTGADVCQGSERYRLIAVQPSPMLCRVPVEAENSYLFLPYGIGGIVDNKVNADGVVKYTGGFSNLAALGLESSVNPSDSSGFKCFGVKDNDYAAFCIGEETPGAFSYNMTAGDKSKVFATVFPTFFFADYDYFYGVARSDGLLKQVSDTYLGTVSMGFYPLSGEKADYNGMAECYRNYLIKSGFIAENKKVETDSPYSVTYLGGIKVKETVLGVSTNKLSVMTSFDDAKTITEELKEETGYMPVVRLTGYGKTGINIGEIAGGYKFPSKFGNNSSRNALEDYVKSGNSKIFTEFGVVFFRESGSGFSYSRSATKTAISKVAEISPVEVPIREYNKDLKYRLISRKNLIKAVDKLISFANKKNVTGISFSDLGRIYYSDYTDGTEYGVSAKIDTETKSLIESVSAAGHDVAVSVGSFFATGASDVVFDSPMEPSGKNMLSYEIPFYQMVFHGVTPMYSKAINTAADMKFNTMLAAASGMGLGFTIIGDYDLSFSQSEGNKLYAMKFDSNYALIKSYLEKYADIYGKIYDQKILRYDILENNITKTTFENGVCIYANHSDYPQSSPVGIIDGCDFVMGGEED